MKQAAPQGPPVLFSIIGKKARPAGAPLLGERPTCRSGYTKSLLRRRGAADVRTIGIQPDAAAQELIVEIQLDGMRREHAVRHIQARSPCRCIERTHGQGGALPPVYAPPGQWEQGRCTDRQSGASRCLLPERKEPGGLRSARLPAGACCPYFSSRSFWDWLKSSAARRAKYRPLARPLASKGTSCSPARMVPSASVRTSRPCTS